MSISLIWGAAVTAAPQDEALARAFPGARIERRVAYVSESQRAEVQRLARAPLAAEVVPYYVAVTSVGVAGYAYFDTHLVRSMPETLMAVVAPDGTLRDVELLAFHEPDDYRPSDRWLAQFQGRRLDDDLRVKRGIRHITGATLSGQSLTDAVRRVLSLHHVLSKETR